MTATRERQSAPAAMPGEPSWAERSAFGTTRGVPLWGAMLIAIVPTALGSLLDQLLFSQSGVITTIFFVVACLLAVALVQRRSLFGPMVQTPLVVSIVLPLVALLTSSSKGGGSGKVFTVAKPLINNFPMMAVTAVLALALGLLRMFYLQPAREEPAEESGARSRPKSGANAMRGRAPASGPQEAPQKGRRPKSGPQDERRRRPDSRGQRRPDEQQRRPSRGEPPRERGAPDRGGPERGRPERPGPERGGPPGRGAPPERGGQQRKQPPEGGRGRPREQGSGGKPPRGERPQRPDRGERPERGERGAPPPGRGGGRPDRQQPDRQQSSRQQPGRQQPGRGRPSGGQSGGGSGGQQPPRRPRKPKRNDFWD